MRRLLALSFALALAAAVSPGALASPEHSRATATARLPANPGLFLNILPAGQGTTTTSADALAYEANGTVPPHDVDQQHMYDSLRIANLADLSNADLTHYYKPESFGVTGGVESTESPKGGVNVKRDSFGVPHITADSRANAEWAAGWVAAEDRLFMMDTLRNVGKGRLSEFLGPSPSNLAMDRGMYLLAGYDDQELTRQGYAIKKYGPVGKQVIADDQNYVDGINARIQYDEQHPDQLPAEYPALQIQPQPWTPADVVAIATLIQAQFAGGGGNELGNALFLEKAIAKDGPKKARRLWRDLRAGDDPSSQVTADGTFDYEHPGKVNRASIAMPDRGTVRDYPIMSTEPSSGGSATSSGGGSAVLLHGVDGALQRSLASVGLAMPDGMSNWLGVTADKSASGHPIAVMGPQVSYFSPEILMEEDIHAPDFNARGAAFPGISQYVLLGRGRDFAWSATSGESDIIDTRAELLCNKDGSKPTVHSTGYMYKGTCKAMYTRDDSWLSKPTAADPSSLQPTMVTMHVRRTIHGPVFATAMVHGRPVAFVTQRSTFFHEVDTALPFAQLPTSKVHDVQSFLHVMNGVTGTFNWLYTDDRDLGYIHSGLYPERKPGMSTYLPTWGTGNWEWQGFMPYADHVKEVNPAKGWMDSWNNRPAHGWNAADAQWAWGPVHRVVMLQERLAARVPQGNMTPADLVSIMGDAATVDLRGDQDVPFALQILGQSSDPKVSEAEQLLSSWVATGSHRVDRNGDGQYDDHAAVALMDTWWPLLVHAAFNPTLSGLYGNVLLPLDDDNRHAHLGSSFQGGYYGYLQKAFQMALGQPVRGRYRVLRCADGTLAGCRAALLSSLQAAISQLGGDPSQWTDDPADDAIQYRAIGLVGVPNSPWQNRPTFQQVVEVTAHRPR